MDSSYIGAYWGGRQESALECGERLARCISALASTDAVLGTWFKRGATKATASTPVELDAAALAELLVKGRNRRDFGGEAIDELGFAVGLWNRAQPEVGLSGTFGAYTSFTGVLNNFVLELPPPDEESGRLYVPNAASAIFEAVIQAWEPEWATWTTNSLRDGQAAAPREPVVGWFTYLRSPGPENLPRIDLRSVDQGVVIQAAPEFTGVDEATVQTVRGQLKRAVLLHPIP